jgi:hypothetical protein
MPISFSSRIWFTLFLGIYLGSLFSSLIRLSQVQKSSSREVAKAAALFEQTVFGHEEKFDVLPAQHDTHIKHQFCSVFDEHFAKMESVGTDNFCPCCGYRGNFTSFKKRSFAQCPRCTALERHRLACMNLARYSLLKPRGKVNRVLSFGPHPVMYSGLESVCDEAHVDHIPVDLSPPKYGPNTLQANAEQLLFPDDSIDLVLSFHVLEHVRKLDQAFIELHRVLGKEGHLLVEVPCNPHNIKHTDCRMFVKDEDRIMCGGQKDHVWSLSCSAFKKELEAVGFSCEESNPIPRGRLYPHPQFLCTKIS